MLCTLYSVLEQKYSSVVSTALYTVQLCHRYYCYRDLSLCRIIIIVVGIKSIALAAVPEGMVDSACTALLASSCNIVLTAVPERIAAAQG